jgi:hypothetical protein
MVNGLIGQIVGLGVSPVKLAAIPLNTESFCHQSIRQLDTAALDTPQSVKVSVW